MMRVKVWTLLVKTPDGRSATVTVHGSEKSAYESLKENFDPEDELGKPITEESLDSFEEFFNLDVLVDSHDVVIPIGVAE